MARNIFDPDGGAVGKVLSRLFPSPPPPEKTILHEHEVRKPCGALFATLRLVEERYAGREPRLTTNLLFVSLPGCVLQWEGKHHCTKQFAAGMAALVETAEKHAAGCLGAKE